MMPLTLPQIIAAIRDLPALPAVVLELMRGLDNEQADTNHLAGKIAQDQALSAKVLRLANSSFYGMQNRVGTIQQAITILGFNSVRALVTASAVIDLYKPGKQGALDFRGFWRHAIATALCAKALAKKRSIGAIRSINQDHAFITGLLHDIGKLVIVTYSERHYEAAMAYRTEHDCYGFEAEQAVLGLDHAAVGRAILEHWKFPVLILDAVEHHHFWGEEEIGGLTAVINLADCIAHGLDLSSDSVDLVPPLLASGWRKLNIQEADLMDVFQETEHQFEEACAILMAND
jgi:putative nucleotidyltransferase with HDIG domain